MVSEHRMTSITQKKDLERYDFVRAFNWKIARGINFENK